MLGTLVLSLLIACGDKGGDDTGSTTADGGAADGGAADGGAADGGAADGGAEDGGSADGGAGDGGSADGGAADGGSSDGGSSDGGSSDGGTECTATLESVDPLDGATDVAVDSLISASLSARDESANLLLTDAAGGGVAGRVGLYESQVIFTPDEPLAAGAAYEARLDWCGGGESWSFTTAEEGSSLPVDPTGFVYLLDLSSGDWTEPSGVGTILAGSMENHLLVEVLSLGDSLELRLGWSELSGTRQDLCGVTQDVSVSDLSALPAFAAGPVDLEPDFGSARVTFGGAVIEGSFSADSTTLEDVTVAGTADLRDWLEFLRESLGIEDAADACLLVTSYGARCEACADGSEVCLPYRVEDVPVEASSLTVDEITEAEVLIDPRCL